jgi:hypothetical protein
MVRRGMPEVRFGSDVYLEWGRHESVLWRTMVRANWPLWVVKRVVLFASPPTGEQCWLGLTGRQAFKKLVVRQTMNTNHLNIY